MPALTGPPPGALPGTLPGGPAAASTPSGASGASGAPGVAAAPAGPASSPPAAPQRREFFRLRAEAPRNPIVHLRHPALPDMRLALPVLDLSVGGCALWLPDDVPPVQPGSRWRDVTLALGVADELHAALVLQHVTCMAHEAGGQRLGCEWEWHEPGDERALQRWIDRTQRRERLLRMPWSRA